ncbi:MAG: cellulase family glycosylhydrolase [Bacteroidales bacterium]|nr:cellulase family glycosylhydrolase [Bacteroidales bacterium]
MKNNLKKIILPLFAAVLILAGLASCNKNDNDGKEEPSVQTEFSVSSSVLNFSKAGGTQTINVTSSSEITVLSNAQWLKVVKKTSETANYVYDITVETNDSESERTAELTFLSGNDSKTVSVTQACTLSQKISVNGTSFKVENLPTNAEIICEALWITHTADGFVVEDNNLETERTGLVIVKFEKTKDTIYVTQAAGEIPALSFESSAMDLAAQMYPAWNLGNTMEAIGSGLNAETSWQSTKTTQELISYVKSLGFRAIRIPCSWYIHCDKNDNYKINASWMTRVKEIVTYCINAGLFVELNDHWDGGWLEELGFSLSSTEFTDISDDEDYINGKIDILKNLWTQIATEMKDFDHHLIFAGLNEPFQNYNLFNGRAQALTPILLKYNQAFVEAVRATGGNNAERVLAVQGPATNIDYTLNYFSMPTDVAQNKLMVEVHYYDPYNFCLNEGTGYTAVWNSENSLKNTFAKMKAKFSDNNIPVIIGEYAANWRVVSNQEKHNASIKAFYKAVSKWGPANGMIPFVWDVNYCPSSRGTSGTGTIINRAKLEIYNPIALQGIQEGNSATVWMK